MLSAWTTGPSDPIMGQPIRGLTPDRSRIRPKLLYALKPSVFPLLMPGLCPVSVKGILAPLSPRGRGAG